MSVEFRRQVAQEFLAGETLRGLAKRYDISRNLIRIGVEKYEASASDENTQAAGLIQACEARIDLPPSVGSATSQKGRYWRPAIGRRLESS
jgi:hypothetical protein